MTTKTTDRIHDASITDELETSFTSYAMSVIVSRALPDVRDGLKPVHRRILYAMREGGYDAGKPYRKSARIVGDVMGKYHPHGDSSIYDSLVRMAQDFSMSVPLIDGQGNFGSMDGDPAAAMRYTESRLARVASLLLDDIEKETVDFRPNYDNSVLEPSVLPARFPNLLVNGQEGIAVGMATKIPPHNLAEVVRATLAVIDNPEIDLNGLLQIMPGPDFPTGGIILGRGGIREAYATGKGTITLQARTTIEDGGRKGRPAIVATELPFQVNKAKLIERIDELTREKIIDGVAEVRDESDRSGVRVVIEVRKDADPELVLAQLFKHTDLRITFSVNMLALDGERPRQMTLKDVLDAFIRFRRHVIRRRTVFNLRKARERAHLVLGQLMALSAIDRVIATIKGARDGAAAIQALMALSFKREAIGPVFDLLGGAMAIGDATKVRFTEIQAKNILELRLQRLTGLEREKLEAEGRELAAEIAGYLEILRKPEVLTRVMKDELEAVLAAFPTRRRTSIEDGMATDYNAEDLIPHADMIVTLTHAGYIKRVPLDQFRSQKRGGKGKNGMDTKENDFVTHLFTADTHTRLLFFTNKGVAFKLKVHQIPSAEPNGRGRPIVNLIKLEKGDTIASVLALPADEESWERITAAFVTASGQVRRNALSDFASVPSGGKMAMKFEENDQDRLVNVLLCGDDDDLMLTTQGGMVARFPAGDVRIFASRSSTGVRGINLAKGDTVISACVLKHVDLAPGEANAFLLRGAKGKAGAEEAELADEGAPVVTLSDARYAELKAKEQMVLTVTTRGFGKRTSAYAYRVTARGAKGVKDKSGSAKIGALVGNFPVAAGDHVMLVTKNGQTIRTHADDVRISGRSTSGVMLFRPPPDDEVVAAVPVPPEEGAPAA